MFRKAFISLGVGCLLTSLVASACQAADLPSFKRITKALAVGGPPTDAGVNTLFNDHFTSVIDLRDANDRTAQEHARVERMATQYVFIKFHYVNIPIGNRVPTSQDLAKFLATLDVSPEQKSDWTPAFYIHGGKDLSTATAMVAIWRIYHDDWDYQKAYSEMQNNGFSASSPHATELLDFVKKYAESRKS